MSNRTRDGRRHQGITVEVRGDDFGRALRTWSKKVQDTGLLKEVKDRMAFEKPAVAKQRLKKQAGTHCRRND
jgi:ribosomal protein S21